MKSRRIESETQGASVMSRVESRMQGMSMKRIARGTRGFMSETRRFIRMTTAMLAVVAVLVSSSGQNAAAATAHAAKSNPAATVNPARAVAAANETEVRRAMERAFQMLRAGEYGGLYDALPTASQRRITRQRFVSGMNRARGMYELDRLEISAVRVAGDLAVVDTVIYARARQPIAGEGKIVSRQYMLREGGQWRVTTGDRSTVQPLLAANRELARKFPPTEPRIYLKRDGQWININALAASMRRRQTK